MRFPSKELVESLRKRYPVGCRVELVRMDDAQAPPVGTKGTVRGVDDIGSVMVAWDNGCGLSVAYGEDACKVVSGDEGNGHEADSRHPRHWADEYVRYPHGAAHRKRQGRPRAGGVSGGASTRIRAFHSHRRSVNYTTSAAKLAVKIV